MRTEEPKGEGISEEFVFFKLLVLFWGIADEQCYGSFGWTAKGLSQAYTCIHSLPKSIRWYLEHRPNSSCGSR